MDIEQEIQNLKFRNLKVEKDKAWEISKTRKVFIFSVTYGIAVCTSVRILPFYSKLAFS